METNIYMKIELTIEELLEIIDLLKSYNNEYGGSKESLDLQNKLFDYLILNQK
jgi:hypothetical protein